VSRFTSDCLETLEEISMEAARPFSHQAQRVQLHSCLNDDRMDHALCELTQQHLSGWPTQTPTATQELQQSKQRALAKGAKD